MNKVNKCILVTMFFMCIPAISLASSTISGIYPMQGARYIGMGSVSAATMEGVDAIYWNPAATAWVENWEFGVNSRLTDTVLNSTTSQHFFAASRNVTQIGVFSGGLLYSPYEKPGVYDVGLIIGFAKPIVENKFALGLNFQYFSTKNSDVGYRISVGLHYRITDRLSFGTVALSRGEFGVTGAEIKVPFHARTGIMYKPISWIMFALDVELARVGKKRVADESESEIPEEVIGPEDLELYEASLGVEIKVPLWKIWPETEKNFDVFVRAGTRQGLRENAGDEKLIDFDPPPWDRQSYGVGVHFKSLPFDAWLNVAYDEDKDIYVGIKIGF